MANKAFEIQNSSLRVGGVELQAGTTGVVIPGITQATSYKVEEVKDRGDQTVTFPAPPIVIDYTTYLDYDNNGTSVGRAEYIVEELDDDGYIDDIEVTDRGSYTVQESNAAGGNDLFAYTGTESNPFTTFVSADWTQIPFRPKMRAGEVETIGGGGADLGNFNIDGNELSADEMTIKTNDGSIHITSDTHVYVQSAGGGKQWSFANDGVLTLPQGGDIVNSSGSSVLGGGGNANTGNITFNGNSINSTENIVEISASEYAELSSNGNYVWADNEGVHIEVNVGEGGNEFIFEHTNGVSKLKLPTGGDIVNSSGTSVLGGGLTAGTGIDITDGVISVVPEVSSYKGFSAHYGRLYDDEPNISKIVIYKDSVSPTSTIDTSTNDDDFSVTSLTGSDVVAMFVVYGSDSTNPKSIPQLKTFTEAVIDNVILDEGIEGDTNSINSMKTAFYDNYETLADAVGGNLYSNFQFHKSVFTVSGSTSVREGVGASFNIVNSGGSYSLGAPTTLTVTQRPENDGANTIRTTTSGAENIPVGATMTHNGTTFTVLNKLIPDPSHGDGVVLEVSPSIFLFPVGDYTFNYVGGSGIADGGANYLTGHKILISGEELGGTSPENDVVITVTSVGSRSEITAATITGLGAGSSVQSFSSVQGVVHQIGSGVLIPQLTRTSNGSVEANNISVFGSNYVVGDVITISGDNIADCTSPENDITLTVTYVDGSGQAQGFQVSSGTLPNDIWPSNSIDDGGADQYDTGNYINTDLASQISYNNGDVVSDAGSQFGDGSSYVVVYNNSIFGVLATGAGINTIGTSGNSGFDGDGRADTGSIFSGASGVDIGEFVFNGRSLTVNGSSTDLYIKAPDDLYLDALDDDVIIRADDDVRIRAGQNFSDEEDYDYAWNFRDSGELAFFGMNLGGEYGRITMATDNDDKVLEIGGVDQVRIKTDMSVDGNSGNNKTWKFDVDGNITLPEGGDIKDSTGNSVLTGDAFDTITVGDEQVAIADGTTSFELIAGEGITITGNGNNQITISAAGEPTTPQYGYFAELVETGSSNQVEGQAVVMDTDGNSYVSFIYYDDNLDREIGGVAKYDSTGEQLWAVTLASQNTNARHLDIRSLEFVTVDDDPSLIAMGHYYDNNTQKDVAFIFYINPETGSVGEPLVDRELVAQAGMNVKDGVAGYDGSNTYAVVVGETYDQVLTKTFTPMAGSTVNKMFVSWSEFAASGVNAGETVYYTDGPNTYGVSMNSVSVTANVAGSTDPAWAGLSIVVGVNQAGNYVIRSANGWGYLVNSWPVPVTLTVAGSALGGVDGPNDMTFDFDGSVFNNNSSNLQAAVSNIMGTSPVSGAVYCSGWGDYDWSTQIGNALTFNYQLNSQAYIARFGQTATWTKNLGGAEYDRMNSVVVDNSQNIYAVGRSWSGSRGSLVVKYDIDGNQQWAVYIDPANNTGNALMSVDLLSDGNVIAVDEDGIVTKLDSSDGSIIWQVKADNGPSWDSDFRGTATPDGDYIITNYEDDDYTQYVMRVSGSDGSSVWNKRIRRAYGGENGELRADDDSQYIDCNETRLTIAGRSEQPNNGNDVGIVYSFPINGENTDGTYGQFVITSPSMDWETLTTTSTPATVNTTSITVTVNSVSPTSSSSLVNVTTTTKMGGEPIVEPTVIEWTNPNDNVWRIEYYNGGAAVSYDGDDYDAKWFDIANHTSGSSDFRGAIIQYHAFVQGEGTIIGTIHLSNDFTQQGATHTEHLSGSSNLQFVTLWDCNNDRGQLYFKMTNGWSKNVMIQWTSTVFYGQEFND